MNRPTTLTSYSGRCGTPKPSAGLYDRHAAARDKYLQGLVAKHEAVEHGPSRGALDLSLAYTTVMQVASPGAR